MAKRYGERIEVEASAGSIEAFRWRGKRYLVRRVTARWRETGSWWADPEEGRARGLRGTTSSTREFLRVDTLPRGAYEIARDLRTGAWSIARVWD